MACFPCLCVCARGQAAALQAEDETRAVLREIEALRSEHETKLKQLADVFQQLYATRRAA